MQLFPIISGETPGIFVRKYIRKKKGSFEKMENHPIPQDVTGFKFKLIGSITVKQFLYLLATFIPAGIILFLIPSDTPILFFLVKVPSALIIALIGCSLAFIPIDGRPMDKMIVNFTRALPSENRYIYRKRGVGSMLFELAKLQIQHAPVKQPQKHGVSAQMKKTILASAIQSSKYKPDESETQFFDSIKSFFQESVVQTPKEVRSTKTELFVKPQQVRGEAQVSSAESEIVKKLAEEEEIKKAALDLEKSLPKIPETEPSPIKTPEAKPQAENLLSTVASLQKQLEEVAKEKGELTKKVIEYAKITPDEKVYKPTPSQELPETPRVRIVNPSTQVVAGFPTLPDKPNIILGIVKDSRGKVLQNILVEVIDKNKIPVRAFKTNALGQFASATPLHDGVYRIRFDDPKKVHEFDVTQVTLNGEIFQPLEVISTDAREKLRRELFEK